MLTFERLIQETAQKLAPEHQEITPAVVRDVLQDAGIDECLRDATPMPQGRLIVNQLSIVGEKKVDGHSEPFHYIRPLGTGLWAWIGANGTGKSTILNCILWPLTGSDTGIPKRIKPWLHDVSVQFSIGEEQFTSRVSRSGEGLSGGIYRGYLDFQQMDLERVEPMVLFGNRDEMREAIDMFFMQHLGITTLRWTAHSPEKDDPDLHAHSTTWRTYAHAIHIEDDSYDDLIIDPMKGYGRQDRKILEMMLGIEHSRTVSEIQVQADFAKEAYGRARSRVSGKRGTVESQMQALQFERMEVEQAIASVMTEGQAPVEADTVFVEQRERRATLLTEQNQLAQEIANLEAQKAGLEHDIMQSERAKVAFQEQSEVEYLINGLVVVRCPHCESSVDAQDRLTRERHDHTCHVCAQPIQKTRTRGDLKSILKERDEETNSHRSALKRVQHDIEERQQHLTISRETSAKIGKELESNVQQARDGFTTTYSTLLVRKGQIDGQLEQLQRSLSEMQAEQTEVETSARWHLILQTAAEIADRTVFAMHEDVFARLSDLVVKLATQFGLPDLEKVIVDEKRYVRLCQGGMQLSHTDLARSERVKFKVAFHLALMLLHARNGIGKHPGFLIIDTPGTAEVNEADFAAMTRDLANINSVYGSQVQILMATARTEALDYLPHELTNVATNGTFF
jgi:hypothetical protein